MNWTFIGEMVVATVIATGIMIGARHIFIGIKNDNKDDMQQQFDEVMEQELSAIDSKFEIKTKQ